MVANGRAVRIVVLARFPVICAGLRSLLADHDNFEIVAESPSVAGAVDLLGREQADVVVLDPDSDDVSLDAVAAISEASDGRVLVLTSATDPSVYTTAIELGAHGVIAKEQPAHLLCRAIEKIYRGEIWLDRDKTAEVLARAVRRGRDPELLRIESLTKREHEIVGLVGEGLGNAAIAERLFISEATVRNHLTSILGKLGLANRFELAVYAFRHHLVAAPRRDGQVQRTAPGDTARLPSAATGRRSA